MNALDRNLKQLILSEVQETFGSVQPPEALLERIEAAWQESRGLTLPWPEGHPGYEGNMLDVNENSAGGGAHEACCPRGPEGVQGEPGKGSLNPIYSSEPRKDNT